jgi:hypothetical protein
MARDHGIIHTAGLHREAIASLGGTIRSGRLPHHDLKCVADDEVLTCPHVRHYGLDAKQARLGDTNWCNPNKGQTRAAAEKWYAFRGDLPP